MGKDLPQGPVHLNFAGHNLYMAHGVDGVLSLGYPAALACLWNCSRYLAGCLWPVPGVRGQCDLGDRRNISRFFTLYFLAGRVGREETDSGQRTGITSAPST